MQQELSTVTARLRGFRFVLFFWCDSNKIMGLMGADCELPLKHQSELFHSAISINLKITFVVGSSVRALVLFLLGGVLGQRGAVSWQGTMTWEVFTDLYRWLRGSELAPAPFLMWFAPRFQTSDVSSRRSSGCLTNVRLWSRRARLTDLVRCHRQTLNPVTRVSRSNDSSHKWEKTTTKKTKKKCNK